MDPRVGGLAQSRAIDFAFTYLSTAEEHNLNVVKLPDEEASARTRQRH